MESFTKEMQIKDQHSDILENFPLPWKKSEKLKPNQDQNLKSLLDFQIS